MALFSTIRAMVRRSPDGVALLLLLVILAMGWSLRTIRLVEWDGGAFLIHPDDYYIGQNITPNLRVPDSFGSYLRTECPTVVNEQGITQIVNARNPGDKLEEQRPSATSGCNSLNPRNINRTHVYGSLPTTLVRYFAEKIYSDTDPEQLSRDQILRAGRTASVLADLFALVLVYVMGRRLASRKVGLLAAFLYAWTPFLIQQSHFYAVDTQAAAYGVLCLYFCLRLADGGRLGAAIGAGLGLGLAFSSKINMAPLVLIIILAAMQGRWRFVAHERDPWSPLSILSRGSWLLWRAMPQLLVAGFVTLVTIRFAMPDVFRGRTFFDLVPDKDFLEALGSARITSSGELDFPPSHQWAYRANYVFELKNMIVWGMGVPLGLGVWLGWAALGVGMLRRASRALVRWLPLWAWVTFYFGWQGGLMIKPMRYMLPIYGCLILFAAWGLIALIEVARRAERPILFRRVPLQAWAISLASMVALVTLLWGWGFSRIYERPHTRIQAAEWARRAIPPGSVVTSDSWDIGIPFLDGNWPGEQLGITNENDPAAMEEFIQTLDRADYLAFTSNRAYGSLAQLPLRFPAALRYFRAVFDGSLGFEKVADFTSFPSFLGVPFNDELAEESWSVYDHPRVTIWRKTDRWNIENARQLILGRVNLNELYKLKPIEANPMPTMLQLTPERWLEQQPAGTWSKTFDSLTNYLPTVFWLLLVEIIGLATFGLLWRWRLPLPDRGLGMARLAGLIILAFAAWLPPALHLWSFSRLWIGLVAALLIGLGGLSLWRSRAEIRAWALDRRRSLITGQLIYAAAFGLLLLIRYLNPDLWHPAMGGEKPMNLAYLTATMKTAEFPPYDPWFAGGYMNYYYWGYVLVGTPMKLLGLRPEIGFNLALPLLYGLTAQVAGSLGYNLLSSIKRAAAPLERRARRVAVATAIAVVLLGNLAQVVLYVNGARTVGNANLSFSNPDQSSQGLWLTGGSPLPDALRGFKAVLGDAEIPFRPEWPYWNATRVIPGTINEFPFFSYLYGDLHAHVIALPMTVLALLLLVALWRSRGRGRWLRVSLAAALGFLVGALRATNTWDFPTYAALAGVGVLAVAVQSSAGRPWRRRWVDIALMLGALGLLMIGAWIPFTRYMGTGSYDKLMLVTSDTRMTWRDFFAIYGLWMAVLVPFGLVLARRVWSWKTLLLGSTGIVAWMIVTRLLGRVIQPRDQYLTEGKLSEFINDLLLEPLRQGGAAISIVLPLLVVAALLLAAALRGRVKRREVLPVAWATAALGLLLLTETVVLPGAGRMNVVFKFGYQAWVLFAVAAATALPTLLSRRTYDLTLFVEDHFVEGAAPGDPPRRVRRPWSPLILSWATVTGLLVLGTLLYPLTATPAKVSDRYVPDAPRGLDGMAWMDRATWNENGEFSLGADAAAIRWLRENVVGTPTVLEASTSPYRWNSGIATWTGLPTLIGWDGHQNQQRAPARADGIIGYRKSVVQQIYTAFDAGAASRLLDSYGVGVVYVGPRERNLYGPEAGSVMAQLAGPWKLAYDQADAKIYVRSTPAPPPLNLLPLSVKAGVPAPDPVANVTLPVTTGELTPVDGVADWPWLGRNQWAAVILWLLFFELIGLLAWPLATLVLRSNGAAAWGSSKALGLVALGWIVWLPASLGFWRWTRGSVLAGIAVLAALGWLAWRFGAAARIRHTWRRQRRELILTELVFISLFGLWTLVRAANPDLWHPYWGGEKPFEAGFLNAVLRSPNMAPVDPFFSGGTINYYYYGLYLVGLPMKLLGLDPAIGFNLAVAVVGALIGVGAWSIGLLVLRRARYAALTLLAVALIGNLASTVPVGNSTGLAGVVRAYQACDLPAEQPRPACAPVETASDVNVGAALNDALSNGTSEGFSRRMGGGVPWFWGPSRVLVDPPLVTINEFPLWSVIFADLHPHLIALPLTLLVVGLAWEASRRRRWRATWPTLAALPLVLGALAPSNAWDVPTYGLLVVLALALRGWQARRPALDPDAPGLWRRLSGLLPTVGWALAGVGLVLGGAVMYAPFLGAYKAPVGGIWPIRIGSPLLPWLTIYGLFLLVIIGWLMLPSRRPKRAAVRWDPKATSESAYLATNEDESDTEEADTILVSYIQEPAAESLNAEPATAHRPPATGAPLTAFVRRLRPRWLLPYALISFGLVIWFLVRSEPLTFKPILTASFGVRLLLLALLALLVPRLLRSREPSVRWAVVLGTLGALVALGSEMVFIRDHLAPPMWENGPNNSERMNTVFKFGYQVWVLWALSAALLLPRLLRGLRRANTLAYGVWVGVLGLLGAASLVFTLFGPISRAGTRFDQFPAGLTLDGLAFMDKATYSVNNGMASLADDAAAIRWITENISGTPVLLQSEQEFYRAYGVRIAANTGLPTIVSALHANEQRPPALVDERVRDVQRIYAGDDPLETQWLLNKYKVDYVYVGQVERLRDPIGVEKFATLAGLQQVYANTTVTIYKATPQLADLALQWRPERPSIPSNTPVTIEPSANDALTAALTKYENDPGNAGNAFDAGIQLWRAGQGERAAAILQTAATQHPGDVGLHHVLGDVLLSLDRFEEATLAYQQAFDAGPTPENKNKLGSGYLAWSKVDPTRLPDTERVLLEAVGMAPELPDPHYQLGETYRLMGDVARARAEYEEYLRLAPADAMWVQASREQLAKLQ